LEVVPQSMVEFWVVATRPRAANGLGLSVPDAEAERLRLEALFNLRPDTPGLYARWVGLVNGFSVSGKPSHDARIAAAMLEHGLTHLLTFNGADFRRFAPLGIVVVDPADVR
jgi:predicted nucleic acid-binding protein